MTEVGRIRVQKSAKIFQILNDIFFNIKDIILKDKKKYFADLYQKNLNIFTTSVAKGQSIVEGTRYIIEIVFILVLSLLMYFSSHLISDKNEFIKFISIFLIAAYRIIPSINRISQSYNDSKSSFQSLKLVENILKINYQNQDNVINKSNLIKKEIFNNDSKIIIENLSYNFSSNGNNIELLNINSTNALLKILEEPNENIYFILIHNNKKILPTLLSRCINFKIYLSNNEYLYIINQLLNDDLNNLINSDLINYYSTPGEIYNLVKFSSQNNYDLSNIDLKSFLKILIKDGHYKKNNFINNMMYNFMELYFRKLNLSFSKIINEKYSYFVKRTADTKTYNLDKESLFMEFNEEILNG